LTSSYVQDLGDETAVDVLHRVSRQIFGADFLLILQELLHELLINAQVLRYGFCHDVQVVHAFGALVGAAMKATQGKGNPPLITKLLKDRLG
jgi:hypothetical protein